LKVHDLAKLQELKTKTLKRAAKRAAM